MSSGNVARASLALEEANKRLNELNKLMDKAFIVFDYESIHACKLSDLTNIIEKFWVKFTAYPIKFNERDYNKIFQASNKVSKAFITREDFNKLLAPYKKVIEDYASTLTKEVEEKEQAILELYNENPEFSNGDLALMFRAENVRDIIIRFAKS